MNCISKRRVLPCNEHYSFYQMETFLQNQESQGFHQIELYAAPPHVWISDMGIDDLDKIAIQIQNHEMDVCAIQADYRTNRYLLNATDPMRLELSMQYYENCLLLARKLHCPLLSVRLTGEFMNEPIDLSYHRAITSVRRLCTMAEDYHVNVAIDPPYRAQSRLFSTCKEMKQLMDAVSRPHMRVNIDTVLLHENGEHISTWFSTFQDRVGLVRMSDARTDNTSCAWGHGVLSLEQSFEELEKWRYRGYISLPNIEEEAYQNPVAADQANYDFLKCRQLLEP